MIKFPKRLKQLLQLFFRNDSVFPCMIMLLMLGGKSGNQEYTAEYCDNDHSAISINCLVNKTSRLSTHSSRLVCRSEVWWRRPWPRNIEIERWYCGWNSQVSGTGIGWWMEKIPISIAHNAVNGTKGRAVVSFIFIINDWRSRAAFGISTTAGRSSCAPLRG